MKVTRRAIKKRRWDIVIRVSEGLQWVRKLEPRETERFFVVIRGALNNNIKEIKRTDYDRIILGGKRTNIDFRFFECRTRCRSAFKSIHPSEFTNEALKKNLSTHLTFYPMQWPKFRR